MTETTRHLLIAALSEDPHQAAAAWRRWRAPADIQASPWQQLQLLPLIPRTRFRSWLIDDPEADRLHGIVRHIWTQSQLRLASVQQIVASLGDAGCVAGVFGATGIHLRLKSRDLIHPLTDLRLLLARGDLGTSLRVLETLGWRLHDAAPTAAAEYLDSRTNVALKHGDDFLHLHWRALDVPPRRVAACEREFLSALSAAPGQHDSFHILAPGHELLATLANRGKIEAGNGLPWQLDAGLVAAEVTQWKRWSSLARRYGPSALLSIAEVRHFGVAIPALPAPRPPSVLLQRLTNAVAWRSRRVKRWLSTLRHSAGDSQ